ncbi:ExbD/TolR family protein [Coraliomargarita parva]|uniref:ExbD/TolR family protein n=1 Tax=Coraliomargarita parva TaxID=3014050 RepID=UPI0022B3E2AC|nr:biopolymer transporter ExbD [Coraliomargarita parva]
MSKRRQGELSERLERGTFTTDFGLASRLKMPEPKLELLPLLDLAFIAMLFGLLFTRFVTMPGVRLDLPQTDLRMQHNASNIAILTVGNGGALYFDGSIHNMNTVRQAFRDRFEASDGSDLALLVKAEASLDLQGFLDICKMAQDAGFSQVQIVGGEVETPGRSAEEEQFTTGVPTI